MLQPSQASDVARGNIARVAAVHAGESLKLSTMPYMAEAFVRHVHRQQPGECRKAWQGGEGRVVHELAAHGEALEGRHVRKRGEAATAEIWAFTAPDVLDGL